MRQYTRQFTREELIEVSRKISFNAERSLNHAYADAMEAISLILEQYPLTNVSSHAVEAVLKDLRDRVGFRDLLDPDNSGYAKLKQALIDAVASKVVYAEPKTKTAQTEELDFAEGVDLDLA